MKEPFDLFYGKVKYEQLIERANEYIYELEEAESLIDENKIEDALQILKDVNMSIENELKIYSNGHKIKKLYKYPDYMKYIEYLQNAKHNQSYKNSKKHLSNNIFQIKDYLGYYLATYQRPHN